MNIRYYKICLLVVLIPVLAAVSVGCTNSSTSVLAKKIERGVSLWNCHGNSLGKWECSDLTTRESSPSQQVSAPASRLSPRTETTTISTQTEVASRQVSVQAQSPPPRSETTTAAAQAKVTTIPATRENNTQHPLLEFPSHYYAVQLLAVKNESTIVHYKNRYPAIRAESISVNYNGNHFQLLILGVYPSVSEARHAIAELSTTPDPAPWIRPLAKLQTFL
jgi:DamX protein